MDATILEDVCQVENNEKDNINRSKNTPKVDPTLLEECGATRAGCGMLLLFYSMRLLSNRVLINCIDCLTDCLEK